MNATREHERHALRVFAWLAALVAVALLGWYGSAALIRMRARERIDAEVARLRAAGEPTTLAEAWGPPPPAAENGAPILDAARREIDVADGFTPESLAGVHAWLASAEGRAACGDTSGTSRAELDTWIRNALLAWEVLGAAGPPPEPTPHDADIRRAWLDSHAVALEATRQAADHVALWGHGTAVPVMQLRSAGGLLRVAALCALDEGDAPRARDELRRLLALGRALEAQPSLVHVMLRSMLQHGTLALLHRLNDTGRLDPVLAELGPDLERARLWPMLAPTLVAERATFVGNFTSPAAASASTGSSLASRWLRPDLESRWWRHVADDLCDLSAAVAVVRCEPIEALARPELQRVLAPQRSGFASTSGLALSHAVHCARHDLLLALARAALLVRGAGVEAARAFLATQVDPSTGIPPTLRVEPDGTVVIEALPAASGAPSEPAADTRLRTWRVRH